MTRLQISQNFDGDSHTRHNITVPIYRYLPVHCYYSSVSRYSSDTRTAYRTGMAMIPSRRRETRDVDAELPTEQSHERCHHSYDSKRRRLR